MKLKKIGKAIGRGAIIAATGGLATPIVGGGLLGTVMLTPVITSGLTTIATIGVVKNISAAKKSKEENEKLRGELKKTTMDNKAKQKVIEKINRQLEQVKAELEEERAKAKKNEDRIRLMEEQLDDLMETLRVAYAV